MEKLNQAGQLVNTYFWYLLLPILAFYAMIVWIDYRKSNDSHIFGFIHPSVIGVLGFIIGGGAGVLAIGNWMNAGNNYHSIRKAKNTYYNISIEKNYAFPGDTIKYQLFDGYQKNLTWKPKPLRLPNGKSLRWWVEEARFQSSPSTPMKAVDRITGQKLWEFVEEHPSYVYFILTKNDLIIGKTLTFDYFASGQFLGTETLTIASEDLIKNAEKIAEKKATQKYKYYQNFAVLYLIVAGFGGTLILISVSRQERFS